MSDFNHKDERVRKLHAKNMTIPQMARKIGHPGPDGIERVKAALKRLNLRQEGETV